MAKTRVSNGDQLQKFIKSNKQARQKIAQKLGYNDPSDYINFLRGTNPPAKKRQKKENKVITIHNIDILDASGSMAGDKLSYALHGINTGIENLKKETGVNYLQTTVSFSGMGDIIFHETRKPISLVETLHINSRGQTALYHTLGEVLTIARKKDANEKVLVNCFTDGQENDSRWSKWAKASSIAELITACENEGFTVTFIGTDKDVANVVRNLHIDASNTLTHDNTLQSINYAFMETQTSRGVYTARVKKGLDVKKGFYKKLGTLK